MGTLYLVATPIGNLEDITLRALRVLREVSLIAAEDTRHTRKLLTRYEIEKPLRSYHEHNRMARIDELITALVDGDVALVSDAGTPGLSDPGVELVQSVIAAGFPVVPVPGPHAATTALVASGLSTERYLFLGFLPRKGQERRAALQSFATVQATLLLYEGPHRLVDCLEDALAVLGPRQGVVARELTKLHEQFVRGSLGELLAHFQRHEPRGEITLLIEGAPSPARRPPLREIGAAEQQAEGEQVVDEAFLRERLRALRDAGTRGPDAVRQVAREHGLARSEVYRLWTDLASSAPE
jgi:16S rRNA (cytidine1402-2'-O)-methyltransferase